MQIDILTVAVNAVPANEPPGGSSEDTMVPGAFAELLGAVTDEATEPEPAEYGGEQNAADEWVMAPLLVPFVPVVPVPETIEGQSTVVPDVESVDEEGTSIAGIDEVFAAAIPAAGPVKRTDGPHEVDSTEPVPAAAIQPGREVSAPPADVAADSAGTEVMSAASADVPAPESTPRVENAAPGVSKDSGASEQVRPPAKAAPVAEVPDAADGEVTATAQGDSTSAVQSTATDNGRPRGTPVAVDTPTEPTSSQKGVAARLARALERTTETTAPQRVETTPGESGRAFDGGTDPQSSFGGWLSEHLSQPAGAGAQPASAPAFNLVAPSQYDSRIAGAGVASAPDASLVPGGPGLPREHDLTSQLVQSLRLQFRDGIGEAVLRLKPEHLGSVAITLRVENGGLKASVQADLPAVRQWLENQQDSLRSALSEHGLRLDRFEVEPDGRQQASPEHRDERSPRRRQPRRQTQSEQPVFEVVV